VLHELPQDILGGAVGLVQQLVVLESVEVVEVVGHRSEEQAEAEFLVRGVGSGEVVLQQVEVEAIAIYRHFIGMNDSVGRGEHGIGPLHANHLRELCNILWREEQQQGVEVHAHHALFEDVARLAGNDIAYPQLIRFVIDGNLCLPVRHHGKQEAFDQDVGDVEVAHLLEITEQCDMAVCVKVELAIDDSLKVEFLHTMISKK